MSKSLVTKSVYVPAPIDGLNLISPPTEFLPTEARQLDNYYIYDWGIRERADCTSYDVTDDSLVMSIIGYTTTGNAQKFLVTTTANCYKLTTAGSYSAALGTNIQTLTHATEFRGYIFITSQDSNGGAFSLVSRFDPTTETWTDAVFTASVTGFFSAFPYKNRLYFIGKGTAATERTSVYYYGVGAISGSNPDTFDFSSLLNSGTRLVWGTRWCYNQGISNDELFVVCSETGEVLVYAGDYPAAANWQLVGKAQIPTPLYNGYHGHVLLSGQDILVSTTRGVISLRQVFAGVSSSDSYYSVSKKVGPLFTAGDTASSTCYPFSYFPSSRSLYVLNYERGAWSRFPDIVGVSSSSYITAIGTTKNVRSSGFGVGTSGANSYVAIGFAKPGSIPQAGIGILQENATAGSSSLTYTYRTAFFDFGSSNQKNLKLIRTLGRDIASNSFNNTVVSSNSFDDSTAGTAVSKATAVSSQKYVLQELAPGGTGQWLSLNYSKTGSNSAMNEISGTSIFYEEGGVY